MAEEQKEPEIKSAQPEKSYTQKDMFIYCAITGLITGVIGYFIGENRGEKKAKEKYEFAVKKWKEKSNKQKSKDSEEEEFVL